MKANVKHVKCEFQRMPAHGIQETVTTWLRGPEIDRLLRYSPNEFPAINAFKRDLDF
jgi:hypothetical protein